MTTDFTLRVLKSLKKLPGLFMRMLRNPGKFDFPKQGQGGRGGWNKSISGAGL